MVSLRQFAAASAKRRTSLAVELLENRLTPAPMPYVVSIERADPVGPAIDVTTVRFKVAFSESVTGVDAGDFQIVTTGDVGTTTLDLTGSGRLYFAQVGGITGTGTLGLNLVDNNTIRDLDGNPLAGGFKAQQTFAAGAGAATALFGDLNGDGKLDLAIANFADNSVSVLLGNGDGSFQAQRSFAAGIQPRALALGDVNGDGKFDLAVANAGDSARILLGNGDGSFRPGLVTDTAASRSLALGDVSGDGKLDLVLDNNQYGNSGEAITVSLGNGDGTFQPKTSYGAGPAPYAVTLADVNGDGRPDIALANVLGVSISVLLGNGNGTFQAQQTFATGTGPVSVSAGDINGDGRLDLAVVNLAGNSVSILLGNGNGMFQAPRAVATGALPMSATLGDINGDGSLDLIVANRLSSTVSVHRGNGDGTFQESQTFASGASPFSVVFGDASGDGQPDLAVANYGSASVSVLVKSSKGDFTGQVFDIQRDSPLVNSITRAAPPTTFTNASSVSFTITFSKPVFGVDASDFATMRTGPIASAAPQVSGSGAVYTVTVGGISGEGTLGVKLVDDGSIRDSFGNRLKQNPADTLERFSAGSYGAALGDVNGDGNVDVVKSAGIFPFGSGSVQLGNGDGTFGVQLPFPGGLSADSVAVGNLNGDAKLDIAVTDFSKSRVGVLLGNGNGLFQAALTFATGAGPRSITVGDVNGDGQPDLSVANSEGSTASVFLSNGGGTFQAQKTFATGDLPYSIALSDVNGDGKLDLVATNSGASGSTVSLLLGNGDGTFQPRQTFSTGSDPRSVAVGDVNGDGKPDLAVANTQSRSVSVLLGNGDGTFHAQQTVDIAYEPPGSDSSPSRVALKELNGDNQLDLIVGKASPFVDVLLGNGDGSFQGQQGFDAGFVPNALAVGDVNHDGRPDLLGSIFLNNFGVYRGLAFTIDRVPPLVTLLGRLQPSTPSTSATTVSFWVGFTEVVTGVDASDFQVVTTGTVSTTSIVVGPGNGFYAITISGITGTGTLGLNLVDGASIYDVAGNLLSLPGGPFVGQTYSITAPSPTTTTLTANPNATTGGTLVTLTATVAPSPGNLGTVAFRDNGVVIPGAADRALVGGIATFQTTTLSFGTHPITADYSGAFGFSASTSNTANVVVSPVVVAPRVVSVTPNGNIPSLAGAQRSRVVSLVVVFDRPVQLDANAFTLAPHTNNVVFGGVPQPGGFATLPTSMPIVFSDNTTWVVTFAGSTVDGLDGFNSLKDGVYDFNISAAKVHPLGVAGVNMAANSTTTFHRLFGDTGAPGTPAGGAAGADFEAVVNTGDNLIFRGAFNNAANYKAFLDFNGDGAIGSGDNLQFRTRFGKALRWSV